MRIENKVINKHHLSLGGRGTKLIFEGLPRKKYIFQEMFKFFWDKTKNKIKLGDKFEGLPYKKYIFQQMF
jgi:hypothetical protein